MFSLLAPAALWLAPLLAVPLALHFMGRKPPAPREFPALPPVAASLRQAMRRHRLEHRLLLLLRLLVLACLILAAAGPVWRDPGKPAPPAIAALLIRNDAWGALPDAGNGRGSAARLRAYLDSVTDGRIVAEAVLPEAGDVAPARLVDPAAATARLLRKASGQAGGRAAHAFVPVFSARDLAALAAAARSWLANDPAARLMVIDRGRDAARLHAFDPVRYEDGGDGLLVVRAATRATRPPLWTPRGGGGPRPARLEDGEAVASLPLPDSGWVAGTFTLAEDDPARARYASVRAAAAWRVPPPATLCHLDPAPGAAYVSRASLGAGGPRLRVAAYENRLPPEARCDLLYLADPRDADETLVARAVAVIRGGGILVLEAGPRFDPVFWNRRLLGPLEAGRFGGLVAEDATARGEARALAALGAHPARWGAAGRATKRFAFQPGARTTVLLSGVGKNGSREPLLVHHRVEGGGTLLVWTTSLTEPSWSDIGLGAWAPLLHQTLFETTWRARLEPMNVHGDTVLRLPGVARLLDPAGQPFTRARKDGEGAGPAAGPFDAPGLYRLCAADCAPGSEGIAGSAGWLAVNAAPAPRPPDDADWKAFDEALGDEAAARVTRLGDDFDEHALYGGTGLRMALLIAAALLLLAEGLVSSRTGSSRAPAGAAPSPNQRN